MGTCLGVPPRVTNPGEFNTTDGYTGFVPDSRLPGQNIVQFTGPIINLSAYDNSLFAVSRIESSTEVEDIIQSDAINSELFKYTNITKLQLKSREYKTDGGTTKILESVKIFTPSKTGILNLLDPETSGTLPAEAQCWYSQLMKSYSPNTKEYETLDVDMPNVLGTKIYLADSDFVPMPRVVGMSFKTTTPIKVVKHGNPNMFMLLVIFLIILIIIVGVYFYGYKQPTSNEYGKT